LLGYTYTSLGSGVVGANGTLDQSVTIPNNPGSAPRRLARHCGR